MGRKHGGSRGGESGTDGGGRTLRVDAAEPTLTGGPGEKGGESRAGSRGDGGAGITGDGGADGGAGGDAGSGSGSRGGDAVSRTRATKKTQQGKSASKKEASRIRMERAKQAKLAKRVASLAPKGA